VAARPEASAAPPGAAADGGDAKTFAGALEVARRPAEGADQAKANGNAGGEHDGQAGGKADEPDAADSPRDPAPPDLTGLMPGWHALLAPVATGVATAAQAASKARDRASDAAALLAGDASSARDSRLTDDAASVAAAAVGVGAGIGAGAGVGVGVGSSQRGERRDGKASSASPALASVATTTPNTTTAEATPRVRPAAAEVLPAPPAAGAVDVAAAVARDDSARRESRAVDGAGVGSAQRSERSDSHAATAPTPPALFAAAAPGSASHEIATRIAAAAADALSAPPAANARSSDAPSAATLSALAGPAFAPREGLAILAPPAAPFEAHLAAALDSPAFAPALATQVKWLVQDGVQQARLSLNPAEMGPVAVQIVLDGTQARVDFSADMASTRAAIEASLPMLAAALHDSGLTLAGGGVFDGQARHGAQGQPQGGPAQPRADAAAPPTGGEKIAPPPLRAARGLVDLVA
jgi:flagellar hook-length control protein FliK